MHVSIQYLWKSKDISVPEGRVLVVLDTLVHERLGRGGQVAERLLAPPLVLNVLGLQDPRVNLRQGGDQGYGAGQGRGRGGHRRGHS